MKHLLILSWFFAVNSLAMTTMPVVFNYGQGKLVDWQLAKTDEVPDALIEEVTIENPSLAYQEPYKNIFLQNERVLVCRESLESRQDFLPTKIKGNYVLPKLASGSQQSIIRQATVYFWANQLLKRMEALGFRATEQLTIIVDDQSEQFFDGFHNAYYLAKDNQVIFPSYSSPAAFRWAKKHNIASSLDPSVIMHEVGHSIFHGIFKAAANLEFADEIDGLNEGFADYFAQSVLDSPSHAVLMNGGKSSRRVSLDGVYRPEMEAHDLGQVILSALWRARELLKDPGLSDVVVFRSLQNLARNSGATAGDLPKAYMDALQEIAPQADMPHLSQIWENFNLKPHQWPLDLSLLETPVSLPRLISVNFTENGLPYTISLIDEKPLAPELNGYLVDFTCEDEKSITLWVLFSPTIKNIIGVYDRNFMVITNQMQKIVVELIKRRLPLLIELKDSPQNFAKTALLKLEEFEKLNSNIKLSVKRYHDSFTVNQKELQGSNFAIDVKVSKKLKFVAWTLEKITKIDLKSRGTSSMDFYVVPTNDFFGHNLPQFTENQTIVGYGTVGRNGESLLVMIQNI